MKLFNRQQLSPHEQAEEYFLNAYPHLKFVIPDTYLFHAFKHGFIGAVARQDLILIKESYVFHTVENDPDFQKKEYEMMFQGYCAGKVA